MLLYDWLGGPCDWYGDGKTEEWGGAEGAADGIEDVGGNVEGWNADGWKVEGGTGLVVG